jgi:hypothetical protein
MLGASAQWDAIYTVPGPVSHGAVAKVDPNVTSRQGNLGHIMAP